MTPRITRDQLAWAQATQGGPAMPPAKPPRKRRARKPEREIIRAVASALRHHPQVAWARRMNTGVARYGQRGERFIRFGAIGLPDFIGQLTDGRFLGVECKAEDGTLSPAQQEFLDLIRANYGVEFVARAAEDVIKTLESA